MRLPFLLPSLTLLIGSCSQVTDVSARFINGRLAFVPIANDMGCIHDVTVAERDSGRIVWKVAYRTEPASCTGGVPLFYGRLPGRVATIGPFRLRSGVDYEISGTAQGSNYFGGVFIITPVTGYRVRDVAPRQAMLIDAAVDNAN